MNIAKKSWVWPGLGLAPSAHLVVVFQLTHVHILIVVNVARSVICVQDNIPWSALHGNTKPLECPTNAESPAVIDLEGTHTTHAADYVLASQGDYTRNHATLNTTRKQSGINVIM